MTSVQIPEMLFILVTILLALILIGVLIAVFFIVKIIADVRNVTETAHQISDEVRGKPVMELLQDAEFRSHMGERLKQGIIKLLPFVATVAAFLLAQRQRKIQRRKKK